LHIDELAHCQIIKLPNSLRPLHPLQRNTRIIIPPWCSIVITSACCIDIGSQAVFFIQEIVGPGIEVQFVLMMEDLLEADPRTQQMIGTGRGCVGIIEIASMRQSKSY